MIDACTMSEADPVVPVKDREGRVIVDGSADSNNRYAGAFSMLLCKPTP
jgi:hypothetical protein